MSSRLSKVSLSVFLILVALVFLGVYKAQAIGDWYRLRNYQAPAQVSKLASEDKLTPYASHILYVTHPKLEDNPQFSKECPQSEQSIVLGCYIGGIAYFGSSSNLFVKTVSDPRLNGVEEVTLAHEMLHAAYDRMGKDEKDKVNAMLMDYYQHGLTDPRIIETMNSYKKSEPNDLVNEMHSIFGTEIADLPTPLDNYYKKYFSDRASVTAFAANYENEFTSRSNQIKVYDQQLSLSKDKIKQLQDQLSAELTSIESDRSAVERSNDSSLINQYNARVSAYNGGVRSLQVQIANYNDLVDKRNALAAELRSLQGSLDNRLSTQPAGVR
jgi:flagellar hook-associated protein FlgK